MEPNSFTKTSFCDIEIDNITTNSTKKYILNQLQILCNIKYNSRYAKVYNEQYSKNLNNPHIFCLKSSGNPYLLFLTQINDENYCFLIDKKTNDKYSYPKMLILPYNFTSEIYDNSLFECELIRDKYNKWLLCINDTYYLKSKSMKKISIIDRINNIHEMLNLNFEENEYSKSCPIRVKKYFDYNQINNVKDEYIKKLPYNTRGIYFIPMRTDYSNMLYLFPKNIKNNKNILKLPPVKKKIIFRIMKTMKPDVYELYLKDDDNLIKKGVALVQNIELSHKLFSYFENKEQVDEVKVECKYDQKFKKWIPISKSDEEISSIYDLSS
jgi:hypothetical protein